MSEKKRCVIVGGADIGDYARVKQYLREDDAIVFCDSGLKHLEALDVKPALIVGDFDSHCNPHLDVETIVLPCEKDDTDTVFAVKTMVQRGYDDFLLIGVIGARLDHTLGNVSILLYLDSLGKKAEIVDDYSEMQIVSKDEVSIEDKYPFFSLLNIKGCARGITIRDAKYPLDGTELEGYPGTTLNQAIDIFNGVGGFDIISSNDYPDGIWLDDIQGWLSEGKPVMICWNDWGGHWQTIIGYDTMGTENENDDVFLVADSYDTTDHNQDGYGIYPAERLMYNFTMYGAFPESESGSDMLFLVASPSAK